MFQLLISELNVEQLVLHRCHLEYAQNSQEKSVMADTFHVLMSPYMAVAVVGSVHHASFALTSAALSVNAYGAGADGGIGAGHDRIFFFMSSITHEDSPPRHLHSLVSQSCCRLQPCGRPEPHPQMSRSEALAQPVRVRLQ